MDLWYSMVPLLVLGVLRAIIRPLAQALVPRLSVESTRVGRLTADLQTANALSMVVGFAAAGFFIVAHSLPWALAIDAMSFLLSAWPRVVYMGARGAHIPGDAAICEHIVDGVAPGNRQSSYQVTGSVQYCGIRSRDRVQ